MATVLKIGPSDHGRPMTFEEFMAGDFEEGYHYELIDGKLYVSPEANLPEGRVEGWIYDKLRDFSREHPEIINYVHTKARVFVSRRPGVTIPEPDVAAYRNFPLHLPFDDVQWQHVSPVLVVEVLTRDDPDKDLVRNMHLYFQVTSIREYWILDTRQGSEWPTLQVYRRHGKRWRRIDVDYQETYITKLLPGFELILDPRR
jgi:Uma2 family endonuclease